MKLTAITFIALLIASFVSISVFNIIGSDGLLIAASIPALQHDDKARLLKNRESMFKAAAVFDEQFYKSIASDERSDSSAVSRTFREDIVNIKLEPLSSSLLNELLVRANMYMRSAMDGKTRIAAEQLSGNDFIVAFDSIHYNYTASEAVMRIIDKVADIEKRGRRFLPDEVSDSTLAASSCFSEKSGQYDYESSLKWFISANALKSSFDVLYLQVLFGKPFYSDSELRRINRKMGRLMSAMVRCTPPDVMGDALKSGYVFSLQGFQNKAKLAEYRSFAVFQNNADIMNMIDSVYSALNMSAATARSVGHDAFQTLGMITLFELYSQNYKKP